VSLQMLQVFVPLARGGLDGRHDCKFGHVFIPFSTPRIVEELNRPGNNAVGAARSCRLCRESRTMSALEG
jgi:hypothetical protein